MNRTLKAIVLMLAALLLLPSVYANRLLTCGFEENDFLQTMWTAVSNVANVTFITASPTPHSGTYALKVANVASTYVRRHLAANKTSGTLWVRGYFTFDTPSTPDNNVVDVIVLMSSSGPVVGGLVGFNGSTQRLAIRNDLTTTVVNGTVNLTAGTWYRLEFRCLLSDTVGELELRYYTGDSTTALETLTITAEDTLPTNILRVYFGLRNALFVNPGTAIYFDDVAINDEAGSFQTSWPGPGKIFLLKPASDNTVAFTKAGSTPAATNAAGADDLPGLPNDGVDFNQAITASIVDRLNLTDLGAEVAADADILLLDLYSRHGSNGTTGTRTFNLAIWDEAGTKTDGPSVSAAINGWQIMTTDEHQVFDVGTRTKANIADFSAGYTNTTGTDQRNITALWGNLEWIESAGAAPVPPRRAPIVTQENHSTQANHRAKKGEQK